MRIATYIVQNLNTQLGVLAFQTRHESPAFFIYQDFSQLPNGFAFVGGAGDVLPQPLVVFGHDLSRKVGSIVGVRGIQIWVDGSEQHVTLACLRTPRACSGCTQADRTGMSKAR